MRKLIIFDLFGTLVQTPNPLEVKGLLDEIEEHARSHQGLYQRWLETSEPRDRGVYSTPQDYWSSIGVQDVEKATLLYSRTNSYWLDKRRSDLHSILENLKNSGYEISLCSNAGFETHNLLKGTDIYKLFNKVVISAEVKALKPEKIMYELCYSDKVAYDIIYFVGDGGSNELSGASALNIKPIQITELRHDGTELFRDLGDQYLKIENLHQLLNLTL